MVARIGYPETCHLKPVTFSDGYLTSKLLHESFCNHSATPFGHNPGPHNNHQPDHPERHNKRFISSYPVWFMATESTETTDPRPSTRTLVSPNPTRRVQQTILRHECGVRGGEDLHPGVGKCFRGFRGYLTSKLLHESVCNHSATPFGRNP